MDKSQLSPSATLWATPSKEWVIPAKPKPGRKPKKDPHPPAQQTDEPDSKGRRVQNRAAQRAFRERKQSQLAELQARVQLYEQGEIERNVALQNVAKRLKEDNERLRMENNALKDKIVALESHQQTNAKKRWREDDFPSAPEKKSRLSKSSECFPLPPVFNYPSTPSPSSFAPSPDSSVDSRLSFEPSPEPPTSTNPLPVLVNIPPAVSLKEATLSPRSAFDSAHNPSNGLTFDCGFCNEDTPCVCREITMQQQRAAANAGMKTEDPPVVDIIVTTAAHSPTENNIIVLPSSDPPPEISVTKALSKSILDDLPAYQPAIPLRRKSARPSSFKPIFTVTSSSSTRVANCSGDPSDCPACSDDSFGRSFCSAFGEAMDNMDCSGGSSTASASHLTSNETEVTSKPLPAPPLSVSSTPSRMIPTNDAWAQFKAHPNVSFADLSLLADVVAKRSKCTGTRIELSPTPEAGRANAHESPVILTDPHAHYREKERQRSSVPPSPVERSRPLGSHDPSRTLVPQEELMRCRRQRIREVEVDAVRDALRILDAKYAPGP